MKRRPARPVAPHIETYVPYLVNRAAAAMLNYSAREFKSFGVTVPQWRILFALWHHRDCGFGQLTTLTSIEPPTLSRLLNGMAASHLVKRSRDVVDARSVTVSLTAAGEALFERMIPFARNANSMYVSGLSASDLAVLRRALITIYRNLQEAQ